MPKLSYTEAAEAFKVAFAAEVALDRVIDAFQAGDDLFNAVCEEVDIDNVSAVLFALQHALVQKRIKARRAWLKAGG